MSILPKIGRAFNTAMTPLLSAPVVGPKLSKSMTEITYTGRKSGRTISLPVAYRREGDDTVIVGVAFADKKTWWRNFRNEPAPITIRLDGVDRTGSGIVKTGAKGTAVIITLDPATAA